MVKNKDVKELNPRDADAKYLGTEPKFDSNSTTGKWDLVRAFNWYNHFYDNKDAREFLAQYLDNVNRTADAKSVRRVNERNIRASYCWMARAALRGYVLSEHETNRLNDEIKELISTLNPNDEEVVEQAPSNRPNVQEIMRERTLEAGGELEGLVLRDRRAGLRAHRQRTRGGVHHSLYFFSLATALLSPETMRTDSSRVASGRKRIAPSAMRRSMRNVPIQRGSGNWLKMAMNLPRCA